MTASHVTVSEIRAGAVAGIAGAVQQAEEGGTHPFLLFEEAAMRFHEPLIAQLAAILETRGRVAWFRGEGMHSEEAYYDTVRGAIPNISYMGSNLDAFDEVLHGAALSGGLKGAALSANLKRTTCWVWTDCDILFQKDNRFFWRVFEAFCHAAKVESEGWYRGELWGHPGRFVPARQAVALVLTARWEILGDEAARANSPLYQLSARHATVLRDLSTRVRALQVVATC